MVAEELEDDYQISVYFFPVACPRCGCKSKVTSGVRGAGPGSIRYHRCNECDYKYKSVEMEPPRMQ